MEDDFRGGFGEESRGAPQWHNHQQNGWETYRANMPDENHMSHQMRDGFVFGILFSSIFYFAFLIFYY